MQFCLRTLFAAREMKPHQLYLQTDIATDIFFPVLYKPTARHCKYITEEQFYSLLSFFDTRTVSFADSIIKIKLWQAFTFIFRFAGRPVLTAIFISVQVCIIKTNLSLLY